MEIEQYSIVLVNLDPAIGAEIKKTRPCVVISPNEMNQFLKTIVVAPMTSSTKKYPTRVPVSHNKKKGMIALDQIRTIDRSRIITIFSKLSKKEIQNCKSTLQETYVD